MGIFKALGSLVSSSGAEEADLNKGKAGETEQCTILAIDDDPEFLRLVRDTLREGGFNVLSSTSGPKGLDMIRYAPSPVRVVLLDYDMPKLNGAETLAFLRRLNPHSKIIAVTGMNQNFLPSDFREGVDQILFKPFKMEDLVGLIQKMVKTYPVLTAKSAK